MAPPSVRVLIADDHTIFRDGLRRLLSGEPDLTVVGECAAGRDVKALVAALQPDVLLIDLALPDISGLDVMREIDLHRSPVRAILLTAAADNQQVLTALELGARGLVLKDAATATLMKAIRCAMQGQYWFGRDQLPNLVEALRRLSAPTPRTPADSLTSRELRVIAAIVEGRTNRDIAQELGISEQTVKNHLTHIFDKLGVSNRLELALYATDHKLRSGSR